MSKPKHFAAMGLTGGITNRDLDSIDGAILEDGYTATVIKDSGVYWYHLNATSGAAANSPFRIAPVTNAGDKRWHLVGTTAKIGALVKLSSNETLVNSTDLEIPWDVAEYDDASFWEGVTNPERLTVPVGVTKVKLAGSGYFEGNSTGRRVLKVIKGGSDFVGMPITSITPSTANPMYINLASPVLEVTAGNYFELRAYQDSGSSLTFYADETVWFSIDAVGFA